MDAEELVRSLLEMELPARIHGHDLHEALIGMSRGLGQADANRAAALIPWISILLDPKASADEPRFQFLGPEAIAATSRESAWSDRARSNLDTILREIRLARVMAAGDDQSFCDALLDSTEGAIAILDSARDGDRWPIGMRLRHVAPWLYSLRMAADERLSPEHERPELGSTSAPVRPLLDHLAERVLARKLHQLELGSWHQHGAGLAPESIAAAAQRVDELRRIGLLPCLRAALIHLDFAKASEGNAPSIHNLAAAKRLRSERAPGIDRDGLLKRFNYFRERPVLESVCIAVVAAHGLVGQHLRGETTVHALQPWIEFIQSLDVAALACELDPNFAQVAAPSGSSTSEALTETDAKSGLRRAVFDLLTLVDLCDTAGVREGLMTEPLWARFQRAHQTLRSHCAGPPSDASADGQGKAFDAIAFLDEPTIQDPLQQLRTRLLRLRSDRLATGESPAILSGMLDALPEPGLQRLFSLLQGCQFWYCERATAELAPAGQLRLLALAMRRAELDGRIDGSRPYHVNFRPLMNQLWPDGKLDHYRVRLLEALLETVSLEDVLESRQAVDTLMRRHAGGGDLSTFLGSIGDEPSVDVSFEPSTEARALLTLLPIYERKSAAAFHATLKTLCDLYGLRKDEFDRVNNEASYLATMNAARSDKSRMLDYAVPGRIVEVGPGGGVVLNLLEGRFPESEIVGLDVSEKAVECLQQKRHAEKRRWTVVQGDAFELSALFGRRSLSTVVFCSILHEIFSYTPRPMDEEGRRERFQLGSVEAMLRAAFSCLVPGGRILIRDGIEPPPGERIIRFKAPEGPPTLELYAKQFEGRPIRHEWLQPDLARMSSRDAMEFLYTYTWGPDAFPYEVREQYGILTLPEYRKALVAWLEDADAGYAPRLVDVAPDLASYLQPGYIQGLAPLVDLFDAAGYPERLDPVPLPDSNCLIVVEKVRLP